MASIDSYKCSTSDDLGIGSVKFSGEGGEYVTLGGKRYLRHELMHAFGGTMVVDRNAPYYKHEFGNAAALGLASFTLTAFLLGLYYAGAMGITIPNMALGVVFFYGGVVEAAAGIWEMVIGNCFAGTVLISFGMGLCISLGAINVEAFGIQAAYGEDAEQFGNALGLFLVGWGIFCFLIFLCTLKSTLVFSALFLFVDIAFFLLAAHFMTGQNILMKVSGIFFVISSMCGGYCAFAGVATKQNSYFIPIAIPLSNCGSD